MTKRQQDAIKKQRYMKAWRAHEISKGKLQQAARDVERQQTYFYLALKYQERVVAEYGVTGKAVSKFETLMIEGIKNRGWVYGWFIFCRAIVIQCGKRHGSGSQPWSYILKTAWQSRWIVYGQHQPGDKIK